MFAGITTNNALPPHYHCPNCHKHEWVPEQKRDYEIGDEIITKILKNGLDYETKTCPECGHEMWSDGFSGDFRSFMGADYSKKILQRNIIFCKSSIHNYERSVWITRP